MIVHRSDPPLAADLDREIKLVAGAFSSDAGRSHNASTAHRIDPGRAYGDVATLISG